MSFSGEVTILVLYLVQQIGILLAVGAQTALLIAHITALKDGIVEPKEAQFGRSLTKTLRVGLFLIIVSGLGAIAYHTQNGQEIILTSPAFVFKWLLLLAVLAATVMQGKKAFPHYILHGVTAGNWYAIFAIHLIAPITFWQNLGLFYAGGMTAFLALYVGLVSVLTKKPTHTDGGGMRHIANITSPTVKAALDRPTPPVPPIPPPPVIAPRLEAMPPPKIISKPVAPPPPPVPPAPKPAARAVPHIDLSSPVPKKAAQLPEVLLEKAVFAAPHKPAPAAVPPKPVASATPVPHKPPQLPEVLLDHTLSEAPHKPAPAKVPQKTIPVPQKDMHDPNEFPEIPALRVMPKTPGEISNSNRASVVQFTQD